MTAPKIFNDKTTAKSEIIVNTLFEATTEKHLSNLPATESITKTLVIKDQEKFNTNIRELLEYKPMIKILVIEDEESVRENILELLEVEGFNAIVAENGCIGLAYAQQQHPDLILCDIRMPELDGYGVLTALRASPATAKIPFLFLTAKAAKTELKRGIELGANAYITKPFALTELLKEIAQALLQADSPTVSSKGNVA
jgi:CheY-like chemotaxis protein